MFSYTGSIYQTATYMPSSKEPDFQDFQYSEGPLYSSSYNMMLNEEQQLVSPSYNQAHQPWETHAPAQMNHEPYYTNSTANYPSISQSPNVSYHETHSYSPIPVMPPLSQPHSHPLPSIQQITSSQQPQRPRITTSLWDDEGTVCFQVDARGICVARRQDNDMVNGTKLLNVTGMSRGKRDGILKNEKGRVVVKVGAMHLKGVWVTFSRAKALATQFNIAELLHPLFVDDPSMYFFSDQMSHQGYFLPNVYLQNNQEYSYMQNRITNTEIPNTTIDYHPSIYSTSDYDTNQKGQSLPLVPSVPSMIPSQMYEYANSSNSSLGGPESNLPPHLG